MTDDKYEHDEVIISSSGGFFVARGGMCLHSYSHCCAECVAWMDSELKPKYRKGSGTQKEVDITSYVIGGNPTWHTTKRTLDQQEAVLTNTSLQKSQ